MQTFQLLVMWWTTTFNLIVVFKFLLFDNRRYWLCSVYLPWRNLVKLFSSTSWFLIAYHRSQSECFRCWVSSFCDWNFLIILLLFRRSSIGTFIRSHPSSESSASSHSSKPKKEAPPKLDYRSMVSIDDMPALFVSFDSKLSWLRAFEIEIFLCLASFSSFASVFVACFWQGNFYFCWNVLWIATIRSIVILGNEGKKKQHKVPKTFPFYLFPGNEKLFGKLKNTPLVVFVGTKTLSLT